MSLLRLKTPRVITGTAAVRLLIIFLIILFLASYLVGLPWSPAPLFQDESDGLARALYWSSFGKTFEGVRWPVLIPWSGQFYSFPAYFYSVAIWSKLFVGDVSFADLRALGSVFVAATALLVFVFARQIRIPKTYALLASLLYVSSPQALLSYRIAWDPIVMPLQVLLAVVGCEYCFNNVDRIKSSDANSNSWLYLLSVAAAGCLSGLLWYGYTAGRLISILLFALFALRILLRSHLTISFRSKAVFVFAVAYLIAVFPVCVAILSDPLALVRTSQELNQFTLLGFYSTIKSLLSHVSYFDYLIFWGDPQRRHSTGFGGVIGFSGWIILLCGLFAIIRGNLKPGERSGPSSSSSILGQPAGLVILYILIATSPSALSFPEIHALRSSSAFPFWSILASLVFYRSQNGFCASLGGRNGANLPVVVIALACGLFGFFVLQYQLSGSSFLASAQQGATYPGISKEYFQHNAYLSSKSLSDVELLNRVALIDLPVSSDESRVLFEYLSRRLDSKTDVRPAFFDD